MLVYSSTCSGTCTLVGCVVVISTFMPYIFAQISVLSAPNFVKTHLLLWWWLLNGLHLYSSFLGPQSTSQRSHIHPHSLTKELLSFKVTTSSNYLCCIENYKAVASDPNTHQDLRPLQSKFLFTVGAFFLLLLFFLQIQYSFINAKNEMMFTLFFSAFQSLCSFTSTWAKELFLLSLLLRRRPADVRQNLTRRQLWCLLVSLLTSLCFFCGPNSDADRPFALRPRDWEAWEQHPQHLWPIDSMDLRRRPHHGGKLPGSHTHSQQHSRWR